MSFRKHAWGALWDAVYNNTDDTEKYESAVECAVIEDFTNDILHELQQLEELAQESGQTSVVLGIKLAIRQIMELQDRRCD